MVTWFANNVNYKEPFNNYVDKMGREYRKKTHAWLGIHNCPLEEGRGSKLGQNWVKIGHVVVEWQRCRKV